MRYEVRERPLPFDHPYEVSVYDDNDRETAGRLGFSESELEEWAEEFIREWSKIDFEQEEWG